MNKKDLCIVAMFKNEGHILNEWIEHYISEGVDHFFMIDHGSTDNYREKIDNYIQKGIIDIVVDNSTHRHHLQIDLYNHYFMKERSEYTWSIICDLDEFIYSRCGFPTIKSYVKRLPRRISQVCIPWKIFGSNGYIQQPEKVVENFTKRSTYRRNYNGVEHGQGGIFRANHLNADILEKYNLVKSIVRTKDVKKYAIHSHEVKYQTICSNQRKDTLIENNNHSKINNRILNNSCLHLNHYAIQSLEWFTNVKMTRGDAENVVNVRNIQYFNAFDKSTNEIVDKELYNKKVRQLTLLL